MNEAVPYSSLVGASDPLALLASTPQRIADLVRGWSRAQWSRSYFPGKWSASQVVLHLAHDELAWSTRARLALTVSGYVPQTFDGAGWVALESPTEPEASLEAFLALRRLNLLLYRRLSPEQLTRTFKHPECGPISVAWILAVLAGHDLHHFTHLRAIAER